MPSISDVSGDILKAEEPADWMMLMESAIVLDSGYNVPGRYMGRVFMGMGMGPYLGTHAKPVTREYP